MKVWLKYRDYLEVYEDMRYETDNVIFIYKLCSSYSILMHVLNAFPCSMPVCACAGI